MMAGAVLVGVDRLPAAEGEPQPAEDMLSVRARIAQRFPESCALDDVRVLLCRPSWGGVPLGLRYCLPEGKATAAKSASS